jgi:hypothetical protein
MLDRSRQHAPTSTARATGPRRLTPLGVLAGFLLAAAIPVAVLTISYPAAATVGVVAAVAAVAGDRALRARAASPDSTRPAVANAVDAD